MKEILGNFLEYIQFHKIPANVLMREIHPLGLVPYSIIMNALAYQVRLELIRYIEQKQTSITFGFYYLKLKKKYCFIFLLFPFLINKTLMIMRFNICLLGINFFYLLHHMGVFLSSLVSPLYV